MSMLEGGAGITVQQARPLQGAQRLKWMLAIALVALVAIGVRFWHLDADPPTWYIPYDVGFQIDEGYKTLSARNLVVFGETHWHPRDNYPGWSHKSPLTHWSYYGAFQALGLELSSVRLVNVLVFTAFFLLTLYMVGKYWSLPVALLAALMIGVNPALYNFSRVALFEIFLVLFLYGGFLSLLVMRPGRYLAALTVLGVVGVFAALTIKLSALFYVAPACLVLGLGFLLEERLDQAHKRWYLIGLVALGLALLGVLLFSPESWVRRLGGMLDVFTQPQLLLWNNVAELSPFLLITAYLCIIHTIAQDGAVLKSNPFRLASIATVVLVPLMLNLLSYNPPRYALPIIPAAIFVVLDWVHRVGSEGGVARPWQALGWMERAAVAILSAMVVVCLVNIANDYLLYYLDPSEEPGLTKEFLVKVLPLAIAGGLVVLFLLRQWITDVILRRTIYAALGAYFVLSGVLTGIAVFAPSYASQEVRSGLQAQIAEGESVAGDWAPFFAAESSIPALYMNSYFNRYTALQDTRPDYFLYGDLWNDRRALAYLQESDSYTLGAPIPLGHYYGKAVVLYRIIYPDE